MAHNHYWQALKMKKRNTQMNNWYLASPGHQQLHFLLGKLMGLCVSVSIIENWTIILPNVNTCQGSLGDEQYFSFFNLKTGTCLIIKMSYQYRNSHRKDETVSLLSNLYNGNPHTWKDRFILRRGPGSLQKIGMGEAGHYKQLTLLQIFMYKEALWSPLPLPQGLSINAWN